MLVEFLSSWKFLPTKLNVDALRGHSGWNQQIILH